MSPTSDFLAEKAALEAVNASGIFQRAPNMARMLNYVCAKYFAGQQDQVKEYTIAVEALGRPPEFDQERDSIVRVEAHRLRKRLVEFYASEGASQQVRIVLPVGQYIPQFVRNLPEQKGLETTEAELSASSVALENNRTAAPASPVSPQPKIVQDIAEELKRPSKRWAWAAVAVLLACVIVALLLRQARPALFPLTGTAVVSAAPPLGEEIRLLGGWSKGPYTDPFGQVWQPDHYASGGYVMNYSGHLVDGAIDPKLYETSREGDFQYDIPLSPGTYELRLHFVEMLFGGRNVGAGGEGSRIFHVDANGKRLLSRFDILSDAAGANLADERVFKDITPDSDGVLHLRFTHMIRDPLVNALEIKPSLPGRMRPVRIVNSEQPFIDQAGNRWEADRYYRGGQLIARPHLVSDTVNPGLYRHARCGNLTYVIPVAPDSKYSVTLYFAEGWIGTGNPVGGGVGSRLFNIFCNAQTLARNFDIYKEAGGAERAITRTYRGLQPNPQGKLVLHLQPVESYACINAIEILDEGK